MMWPFTHRHTAHRVPTRDPYIAQDALFVAFSFLTFHELVVVQRVCRDWYHATSKERPRDVHVQLNPVALAQMCDATSSSLRRHISRVACSIPFAPSVDLVAALLSIPPRIQLYIQTHQVEPWMLYVPSITRLDVETVCYTSTLICRQMSQLRVLHTTNGMWAPEHLSRLCVMNALHQLQELSLHCTILGADDMSALVALPALTAIEPLAIHTEAYAWLPHVRGMQRLAIDLRFHETAWGTGDEGHLCHTRLRACIKLTHLTIRASHLDTLKERLVIAVPGVQTLCMHGTRVGSLAFLREFRHLTRLDMHECGRVSAEDIMRLNEWAPGLAELRIERCFSTRGSLGFTRKQMQLLRPPNKHFPLLVRFAFKRDDSAVRMLLVVIVVGTLSICALLVASSFT